MPFDWLVAAAEKSEIRGVWVAGGYKNDWIDEATAKGRCITSYPGAPSGPDPLSPCQWDMSVINAGATHQAKATGKGVRVGVIDGGVDFSHPDLAGAIDVAAAREADLYFAKSGKLKVVGAIYDLKSGKVRWLDEKP